MKIAMIAAIGAAVIGSPALAGLDRFLTTSMIMAGSPPQEVGAFSSDYETITADLDSAIYGRVTSDLTSSESGVLMTSSMSITGGHPGQSSGSAYYELAEETVVRVDWDWSDLDMTGDWSIMDGASTVASLAFSNFGFSSTGGSFGSSGTGTAFVTLGPGNYHFGTTYNAQAMPATSSVQFTFVVPAPGALALLGAAALVGGQRRR
jgi:hypothetical protein